MNYRTSYKVLIQCKKCGCRQEATISKDIESNIQFYNQVCLGCGILILTENEVVDIPTELGDEIMALLVERREYEIGFKCYERVYYDLGKQRQMLSRFPNQGKAITLAKRRVHLRKDKCENGVVSISLRLLELNFKSF